MSVCIPRLPCLVLSCLVRLCLRTGADTEILYARARDPGVRPRWRKKEAKRRKHIRWPPLRFPITRMCTSGFLLLAGDR